MSASPKCIEAHTPITTEAKAEKKSLSSWNPIMAENSLDRPFTLGPEVTCQTGKPLGLSDWLWQGSLLSWCHHHVLFMSWGETGHVRGEGWQRSAPSLGCKNYLFSNFCGAHTPPPPRPCSCLGLHQEWHSGFLHSLFLFFLVFGLAVGQGNWGAFPKSRWAWGRSHYLLQYFNSLTMKVIRDPFVKSIKQSQRFQIKIPTRRPTRRSFSREKYPGMVTGLRNLRSDTQVTFLMVKTTLC